MSDIKRIPSDIDLTERNTFGRVDNVFSTELAKPKDVSQKLQDGYVDPQTSMAQYYKNISRYFRYQANSYATNLSSTYNVTYGENGYFVYKAFPKLMDPTTDKQDTTDRSPAKLIELMEDYINGTDTLEEIYEFYKYFNRVGYTMFENGKLYVMPASEVVMNTFNCNYDFNYTGNINNFYNDTISTITYDYSSAVEDVAISITPSLVDKLLVDDMYKYKKDPDDLSIYIGRNAEYIQDLKKWCDILTIFNACCSDVDKWIHPTKRNAIKDKEEFLVDIDKYKESYNLLDKIEDQYERMYLFKGRLHRSFERYRRDDTLSDRIKTMMENSRQKGGYSEYPGIIVESDEVTLAYADYMRPTRYMDRGLHLLQHVNPVYETIEYDLNTMQAVDYDVDHRPGFYPRADLMEGRLIVKHLTRKEEERENGRYQEILTSRET